MAMQVRSVPRAAREDFRAVLSLPDEKLSGLGQWVMERIDTLVSTAQIDDAEVKTIANRLGISRAEVARAASLILNVLMSGEKSGEFDQELVKDLGLGDLEGKVRILLQASGASGYDVGKARQKGIALSAAIPTLGDVDARCDLRGIFRSFASANPSAAHATKVKMFLGFEPIAIVSLQLNDAAGEDSSHVFQLSE